MTPSEQIPAPESPAPQKKAKAPRSPEQVEFAKRREAERAARVAAGEDPDGRKQHRRAPDEPEPEPVPAGKSTRTARVPSLLAAFVALLGILNLVTGLTRLELPEAEVVSSVLPHAVTDGAAATVTAFGVVFLLLAKGLRRRKQRSWVAVVVLLAASAVVHLLKTYAPGEALLSLALLVVVVLARKEFTAEGDPRTRWRALWVFLLLLALDVVVGLVLLSAYHGSIVGSSSLVRQVAATFEALIGIDGPLTLTHETYELFSTTQLALGVMTILVTVYLVLRPAEPVARLSAEDEERMRALLAKHGHRDSLGYFALRRDKTAIWSESGKSCVAARVVSGVLLCSGDPLGDPEAWAGSIAEAMKLARLHAWTPAVLGCSEAGAEAWSRAGLDALEIGDEAVVEVADFTLDGRAMRNVRQAVNRVERAGYTATVDRVRDIPPEKREIAKASADAWRGTETERGFSMALGRFGDVADDGTVVVTAWQDGTMRAFLHFVPWGRDGLSLDLMRRDRDADNGLNELLIVAACQEAGRLGVKRISLNFAVFRSALERGEKIGAGFVLRGWRGILVFASRWVQIESLYKFNAKFRPIWEPRYVCYPSARDLPRVAVAMLEAEAFLVLPRWLGGQP